MLGPFHRDEVFVPGGEPIVTYVEREELHVERSFSRAIATPNQIVSLAGPTKTGKTVLCKKVLAQREYIWTDGGQISSPEQFWNIVRSELSLPDTVATSESTELGGEFRAGIPVITAGGSRLERSTLVETRNIESVTAAIAHLLERKILLVIDDFHYVDSETRTILLRNLKGAVFNGLKVILLSATHRAFDAIRDETELTGRFTAITLPPWNEDDLAQIAILGFDALRVNYAQFFIERLAKEAQQSPFLMQTFCWEICYDCGIESNAWGERYEIQRDYNLDNLFQRIAKDAGLPIYQKLVAGPQSRKARLRRPLKRGGDADIYQATLLALAETGPKSSVAYDELRASFNKILSEKVPQKQEITAALKHLRTIALKSGGVDAIDWDEDKREVNLADPYLRFYLRWQVREKSSVDAPLLT